MYVRVTKAKYIEVQGSGFRVQGSGVLGFGAAPARLFPLSRCLVQVHDEPRRCAESSVCNAQHDEMVFASQVSSFVRRIEVILGFYERTSGDSDKLREVSWEKSTEAFGNVPRG